MKRYVVCSHLNDTSMDNTELSLQELYDNCLSFIDGSKEVSRDLHMSLYEVCRQMLKDYPYIDPRGWSSAPVEAPTLKEEDE